jgi:hypothetical protein
MAGVPSVAAKEENPDWEMGFQPDDLPKRKEISETN